MSQEISIIKRLLERLAAPQDPPNTRRETVVENRRVEQQVAQATTRGYATSTRCTNSQRLSWSQVESTYSATSYRRRRNKAGPSTPQNKTALSYPLSPEAQQISREREPVGDIPRPSCNVFDSLSQNKEEGLHSYLDTRRTSATSK